MVLLGYIGPGGGFAVGVSIFSLLVGLIGHLLGLVLWPFSALLTKVRRRGVRYRYAFRKVVILGLDGLDPRLVRRFMQEHKLPHMQRLAEEGHFSELATTLPALTPAAWPSFMTGNDPSHHGIFDFIERDPQTYLPQLSSFDIHEPRHALSLGPYRIPLGLSRPRLKRQGVPFWHTLGRHGLESTILRVPITFPPQRFRGRILSGMCVPDLLGSQGTSTLYTEEYGTASFGGGRVRPLVFSSTAAQSKIDGPMHPWSKTPRRLVRRLTVLRTRKSDVLQLRVGQERIKLAVGHMSPWVHVTFRAGPLKIRGQVRFQLVATQPMVRLYMTPVQIDPEAAAMSISQPRLFANYLAKLDGPYGTVGMLEDTSALNEGVLDEEGFLQQARGYFEERRAMFFEALKTKADDVTVVVFDTPDRIQHMFWRYCEADHPARQVGDEQSPHRDVIKRLYVEMDRLVGETLQRLPRKCLLLVLSDHGFASFERQVDLNAWLHQHGYLTLREGASPDTDWLDAIDWSQTKAYAMGLTGIFINMRGREAEGIVESGTEYQNLVAELGEKLEQLVDPGRLDDRGQPRRAIHRAYATREHFHGPYKDRGPDLLIGYDSGYRCAWSCAKGQVGEEVLFDNTRAWSGDHCIDPSHVPGVLLANQPLPAKHPRLIDLASTVLDVFGLTPEVPSQGHSLLRGAESSEPPPPAPHETIREHEPAVTVPSEEATR